MQVTGKIEKKGFGFSTWALVAEDGTIYELKDPPQELRQAIAKVQIEGQINEEVMTIAMIGPVLEVESFQILS